MINTSSLDASLWEDSTFLELLKDRDRLDWIIKKTIIKIVEHDGRYAVYFGPTPDTPWCDTPRAAIDMAMDMK